MTSYIIPATPVPAPRQTQADRWRKRPCVLRYRAFADLCRLVVRRPPVPLVIDAVFHLPMPESWSKKRRSEMAGQPHRQRPDTDNLLKALCDALWEEDGGIADMRGRKVWTAEKTGKVELTISQTDSLMKTIRDSIHGLRIALNLLEDDCPHTAAAVLLLAAPDDESELAKTMRYAALTCQASAPDARLLLRETLLQWEE